MPFNTLRCNKELEEMNTALDRRKFIILVIVEVTCLILGFIGLLI